jgi:hypothetical protein
VQFSLQGAPFGAQPHSLTHPHYHGQPKSGQSYRRYDSCERHEDKAKLELETAGGTRQLALAPEHIFGARARLDQAGLRLK